MGVTYDAGALIAADRGDRAMWALHRGYLDLEVIPTVPAPVLAQVWRGGLRQARLARLLRPCVIESFDESQAKRVGALAAVVGHTDIVDVAVVESATRRGDAVVTSDHLHLGAIASAGGVRLELVRA